jgi:hypothetical protein
MGGRGTFAAGNAVAYSYQTIGTIYGVKVLAGINGKHGLPESAHSSDAYIKLNHDGTFREMRFYGKDHVLQMEIAYHPEESLTGNRHEPVLHYHLYDSRFSINKSGSFSRTEARPVTDAMKRKYRKYFVGVSGI